MFIIIDLDGVLLDDLRFKRAYIRMFGEFGIPQDAYQRAYGKSKRQNGDWYEPELHIRVLKKRYPEVEAGLLKKQALMLAGRSHQYLYPDAEKFLKFVRPRAEKLILISSGPDFPKKKVEGTKLQTFFDEVRVVKQASKVLPLKKILKEKDRAVFIDDKRKVIDEIKQAFPKVFSIQVRRRGEMERSTVADAVVPNLEEVIKILKRKFFHA